MSPQLAPFTVRWTNPVTGLLKVLTFETRKEAEAYITGRDRKYGAFPGYVHPAIETP